MSDRDERDELLAGVRSLLEGIEPWLAHVSVLSWDGSEGFLPILRRSMVVRQAEALGVTLGLVERGAGSSAVPLVRPACEELLWLKYLESLPVPDANELADCLIQTGVTRDLEAQAGEVGDAEMKAMGLMPYLQAFRARDPDLRARLRTLGKHLGWPGNVTRMGEAASTWFVAKKTGSESLYKFLYHATSRYVHFSPLELARRGWGQPGRLKLSSDSYEPVWARFALTWGSRVFAMTLSVALDALEREGVPAPDHEAIHKAVDRITAVPMLPIVTPDELVWESVERNGGFGQLLGGTNRRRQVGEA